MGVMYINGVGVVRDIERGMTLLRQAKAAGSTEASTELEHFQRQLRQDSSATISPAAMDLAITVDLSSSGGKGSKRRGLFGRRGRSKGTGKGKG